MPIPFFLLNGRNLFKERRLYMIDRDTIQSAKAVDMNLILDEFDWEKNKYGQIRCPHPHHNDNTPSCAFSPSRNTCKCFGCGETFDTIDLYQCLSEKVNGRVVPFHKAVEEILMLDDMAKGSSGSTVTANISSQVNAHQPGGNKGSQDSNVTPYEMIVGNSRPMMGYELNYLHSRGIMIYDSYVHGGEVHTAQGIDKALQTETDQNEINRLNDIKASGTFYKGIAPILKANKIQIKHNYWEGVNSIIYLIDYEADDEDDLCLDQFYMNTERHMAVQKSLDGSHIKRALGASDFSFITKGMEHERNKDIYICEGIEDALSCTMNGIRSISLNSIANLKSLTHYLSEEHAPHCNERFIICFDHDDAGRKATQELKGFFEEYNQDPLRRLKYDYTACDYPQEFHDINDYWKSRIFG